MLDRLLGFAVTLLAIALALTWAWRLLQPLLPIMAVGIGVTVVGSLLIRRYSGW
jgi:hypothetical protein